VDGTDSGAVAMGLAAYVVVPEVFLAVLRGIEQGVPPPSTMTWQRYGVVRGMGQHPGARAEGHRGV
jgi:hypothetical protein